MGQRLIGIFILTGMIMSVFGSITYNENMQRTGVLLLLAMITIIVYRYLKFYALNPIKEFTAICLEQKKLPSHYEIKFRVIGADTYEGQARLELGEQIKLGDRVKLKVKGPVILEFTKISSRKE